MCTSEKLDFKIFRGCMTPHSALDIIFAGLTLNCFRRAWYFQSVILSIILRILRTQKDVSFLYTVEKGAPSVLYRDIYFKDS